MSGISSKSTPAFDSSAVGFRAAAGDLGEVISHLSGGIRPAPGTVSRLCKSLRTLQGFLIQEALEQAGREEIMEDAVLTLAVQQIIRPVSLVAPIHGGADAHR